MSLELEIKLSEQTDELCQFCEADDKVKMLNIGQVQYYRGRDFNVCEGCVNNAFQKYADDFIDEISERRSHLLSRSGGPLFNGCGRRGI